MKISVVIPSSNGSRFLAPCLDALRRSRLPAGAQLEPVVVDNGSSDSTPEVLARHPEAKALVFPQALGFSRANNAARAAVSGEIVCFLNNDTRVDPGWLERPLQIFSADPRVVGVGSKLLYMHEYIPVRFSMPAGTKVRAAVKLLGSLEDKVRWSAGVRDGWVQEGSSVYVPLPVPGIDAPLAVDPVLQICGEGRATQGVAVTVGKSPPRTLDRLPAIVPIDRSSVTVRIIQNAGNFLNDRCEGGDAGSGEEDGRRFNSEEVVPAICGAAMFARREALDAVGWFPDYYTMYYEDVDLCLTLRSRGGLLVFCPTSVVNHYHTGTNREHSPRFVENVARSSLLFLSRYGPPELFARMVAERIGHARNELVHGGGWKAAAGTRGFLSAFPALPRPLASRLQATLRGEASPSRLIKTARRPYPEAR